MGHRTGERRVTDHELREIYARILASRAEATGSGRERCVSPENIQQLAEGTVDSESRLLWMDHIAACPMCMYELALCRAAADAGAPVVTSRRKPQLSWLALAAAVAALAVGAVLWRTNRDSQPDVMRGTGSAIQLIQPGDRAAVSPNGLALVWFASPRAVRYDVEILDPAGTPVLVTTTSDTLTQVPATTNLVPGRDYRWRITALLADGSRLNSKAQLFQVKQP
jgi:hypothetical protein